MNARNPHALDNRGETEPQVHIEWESRFGLILIDILDGVAYVNGERVEPSPQAQTHNDSTSRSDAPHLGA